MPGIDQRLLAISDMLIKGESTADIGTDHALLPIYMVENSIVPRVIVTELTDGPYQRAANAVQNSLYRDKIEVRQGNGLQVLEAGEVVNIIIAGMGGETIVDILSCDWQKSESYARYVFQPMSRPQVLRRELSLRGWPILDERLVEERNRYFVIISSCPGNLRYILSPLELEVGPVILRTESEFKKDYLKGYLKKYVNIYHSLMKSTGTENHILEEYRKIIGELEEILGAGKS